MAFFPPQPLFGTSTFTLYSPSWLILALHLLIRQVPTSVPVPSTVPPCFLLVAMIEVTLSRRLFSLTWLGRWRVHLMRRGRIYPEPVSHRTPRGSHSTRISFRGLFGGSLQRDDVLPFEVLECRGQGHPRLYHRHFGLSPFVLGKYPPRHGPWALVERGPDRKFPSPTIAPQNPAIWLLGRIGGS